MRQKGCDASWENDIEPPPKYCEYSDDEEERSARRADRHKKRQNKDGAPSTSDAES